MSVPMLILDNVDVIAKVMSHVATRMNKSIFPIHRCTTSACALQKLREILEYNDQCICIIDYHLDEKINGIECTQLMREIHKIYPQKMVFVIGCSAYFDEKIIDLWMKCGADHFFLKSNDLSIQRLTKEIEELELKINFSFN